MVGAASQRPVLMPTPSRTPTAESLGFEGTERAVFFFAPRLPTLFFGRRKRIVRRQQWGCTVRATTQIQALPTCNLVREPARITRREIARRDFFETRLHGTTLRRDCMRPPCRS